MLVLFLLQDDHDEKLYSVRTYPIRESLKFFKFTQDPSEFVALLYNAMSSSSTSAATLDVTPPSPTPSSRNERSGQTPPPQDSTTLQVQDTPYVIKQSGKTPHSSLTDPKADLRNVTLAKESLGHFVGPVSADYFLEYVPATKDIFIYDVNKAKEYEERIRIAAKTNESAMYKPFCEMMADMLKCASHKFKIVQTADHVLTDFFGSDIKPDFVIHRNDWEKDGEFQLQNIELMIELKHHERFDPFVDHNKDKVEGTTQNSEDALGQSICYATCHESIQGRTCVFQVFVIKDYARLLRWDRSGAIVTCKIPLSDSKFFEFFWRFCHLEASERGWDMTMESPSLKDVTDAKDKLLKKDSYIVHRIFSGTQSPFGRGTRGYAAYRKKDGKVRFLKSTWRVVGEGRKPEHEIYATLHAAEVQYIPTVVEYLEVANHVTKTQDTPKSWRKNNVKDLRKFQHYIIVFEELCRPIEKFQSRQQLLTAFANAAEAHHQALDRAMILHRDISAGNILITKNGEGQLGDWELAKHLDDIKKGGSQPERTGTFQFLSARFVSDKYNFGHHDRKDDIESFFHTLQWIVLRFVNHGMSPVSLGTNLYNTFDANSPGDNGLVICQGRLLSILDSIWVNCKNFDSALPDLLEDLRKTINSRYLPADVMDRAKRMYVKYQTLEQQLHSDPSPDKTEYLEGMRIAAEPAILYEQLEDATWFLKRLRKAADKYDQEPGEASSTQNYEHVQTQGSKKTTKFENRSYIEYYSTSVSKRLKLDTSVSRGDPDGADPACDSKNPDEIDDTSSEYQEPRTRKTPQGKKV
ncbi:hypothetical protein JOM56_001510 [Amanita muscaria]